MRSPGSCRLCNCPLEAESESGLCPTCLRTVDTSLANPRPAPDFPVSLGSDVSPEDPDATGTFAPRLPEASTATGSAGVDTRTVGVTPPPPVPLPPAPAGYDLFVHLGGGGMGDVFLAREHVADRLVAMKFLRAAGSPSALERFLAEVRALAALNHPNIVGVLSTDFLRVDPYFTMELARGGSLGRWVEELGPLAPADAARLTATVARAIATVHRRGILHRDLKPSNILLALPRGSESVADNGSEPDAAVLPPGTLPLSAFVPQVGDLGLAKQLDADEGLTPKSAMLGTLSYAPPEQLSWRNGEPGPASDVYGLGATLFHLLTGRPPFGPGSPVDVMQQVLTNPVPRVRAVRPEVPLALEAIVVKCLEKDPRARYQTADALADDLDRFLAGQKPAAPPLTRWRRVRRWVHRNRRGIGVALGTAVVVVGLVVLGPVLTGMLKQDPVDAARKEAHRALQVGKSFDILGPTGEPRTGRWVLGAPGFTNSPEGACAFETLDHALLELIADPGVDRYKLTADLQMLRTKLVEPTNPNPPTQKEVSGNMFGLYFAHSQQNATDGPPVHAFLAVTFNDYLPQDQIDRGITKGDVQLRRSLIVVRPDRGVLNLTDGLPDRLTFPPAKRLPGEWRRVRVDISPEGIRISWWVHPRGEMVNLAVLSPAEIQAHFNAMQANLSAGFPALGVTLPPWRPRMPVGIWSRNVFVAFRNVTLEP